MSTRLGDTAPNFTAQTTEGSVDFHQWLGDSWGVLFSHPADFTPVCTTELGTVAKIRSEFAKRNVKVLAVSVDSLDSHQGWIRDINETQACTMNFPIIADPERKVATAYDMIHPNADSTATVTNQAGSHRPVGKRFFSRKTAHRIANHRNTARKISGKRSERSASSQWPSRSTDWRLFLHR